MLGIKERIVKVALGKAHVVTITEKGTVYTFGINNKGQCGRDLFSSVPKQSGPNSKQPSPVIPCKEHIDDEIESEDSGSATEMKSCAPGDHSWSVDQCMICTQCGQCTVSPLWTYRIFFLFRIFLKIICTCLSDSNLIYKTLHCKRNFRDLDQVVSIRTFPAVCLERKFSVFFSNGNNKVS